MTLRAVVQGAGGGGAGGVAISAGTNSTSTGTVVFSNSNGVSFGLNTDGVLTGSVGAAGGGLTNINISAGTTSNNLSAFTFNNGSGISFGLNGSVITATVQTNYLTTAMASNRGTDFVQAAAVFNGTNASGTIASGGISVSVGNYITTAMASNRASDFVAATAGFNGTNASGTIASNSISISIGNYITTARASTDGLGLATAGTNITWTANSAGVSINAAGYAGTGTTFAGTNASASITLNSAGLNMALSAAAGAGGGFSAGVSTGGNTAGNTGITGSRYVLQGSGVVTMSQATDANGGTGFIQIPATSSLVGTSGISLSTAGSTISIGFAPIAHFEPLPLLQSGSTTYAPGAGSWYFQPVNLPFPMSGGRINMMVAHGSTASVLKASTANYNSNSTGTGSTNFTYGRQVALYSLGAGTNSTRLESFWSNQFSLSIDFSQKVAFTAVSSMVVSEGATMSMITSIDSAGNYTTSTIAASTTVSSSSTALATTAITSNLSSMRNILSSQMMIPVGMNTTLNPGQYWIAMQWNTASTTATTGGAFVTANVLSVVNQYGMYGNTNTAARIWGATAATSGSQPFPGMGFYSATSGAPPSTVALSDVRSAGSQVYNYFNIVNSTI